jgi:hypothetical protein
MERRANVRLADRAAFLIKKREYVRSVARIAKSAMIMVLAVLVKSLLNPRMVSVSLAKKALSLTQRPKSALHASITASNVMMVNHA